MRQADMSVELEKPVRPVRDISFSFLYSHACLSHSHCRQTIGRSRSAKDYPLNLKLPFRRLASLACPSDFLGRPESHQRTSRPVLQDFR
jgi:hypothetical protein